MRTARIVGWSALAALLVASGAWAQAQPKEQTATQFYLEYRVAFDKATKIEDVLPYMAAKNRKQAEDTPRAERDKMFGFIKMVGALTDIRVTKEEHTDGGALLTVEGVDPDKKKTRGKITIVKEGGAWKLGKEEWSS